MTQIDCHDQAAIPAEVDAALRRAALAAPPPAGDLAGVLAKGRVRRRRRAVAWGGAVAAVAVAAVLAAPAAVPGPSQPVDVPAVPAVGEPAQRLLLDAAGYLRDVGDTPDAPEGSAWEKYEYYRRQPGVFGVLGTVAEVLPGGEVVELDLAGLGVDGFHRVLPLPEGRLLGVGYLAPAPEGESGAGPCFEGVTLRLLVVEAGGTVSDARDLPCESSLLAAGADTAYLVRDRARLVAHDLATGAEQVLLESPAVLGQQPPAAPLSFAAGRLVRMDSTTVPGACPDGGEAVLMTLTVVRVPGGETSQYRLDPEGCFEMARRVRVSPDGAYAAIAFDRVPRDGHPRDLQAVVVDLSTGDVLAETMISAPVDPETGRAVAGMAWSDDHTVRVAWYREPKDEVVWLPDVVEVSTFTVP